MGDQSAIRDAEAALEQAKRWLREMEKAQRSAEAEVEDASAKLKEVEAKLYGGKVTNLKELSGLQEESEQLKARLKQKEDRVLEAMGEVEAALKSFGLLEQRFTEIQARYSSAQDTLTEDRDKLQAVIARLTEKRAKLAQEVAAPSLKVYEGLREPLQGRVLAKVEQGRCQGCRLSLSVSELKLARGSGLVQCSSCRRILFLD